MSKNIGDEAVDSVDGGPLINYDEELTTHASRNEEDDSTDPLNDVEEAQKEEGSVVN